MEYQMRGWRRGWSKKLLTFHEIYRRNRKDMHVSHTSSSSFLSFHPKSDTCRHDMSSYINKQHQVCILLSNLGNDIPLKGSHEQTWRNKTEPQTRRTVNKFWALFVELSSFNWKRKIAKKSVRDVQCHSSLVREESRQETWYATWDVKECDDGTSVVCSLSCLLLGYLSKSGLQFPVMTGKRRNAGSNSFAATLDVCNLEAFSSCLLLYTSCLSRWSQVTGNYINWLSEQQQVLTKRVRLIYHLSNLQK